MQENCACSDRSARRARYLTGRIIAFLRNNNEHYRIRLTRLRGNTELCAKHGMTLADICGLVDWDERLIIIDVQDSPLNTIAHEVLHVLYPDAEEKEIVELETLVMEHLSDGQAVSL